MQSGIYLGCIMKKWPGSKMAPGYKQQEECHSEATCQQVWVVLYQVTLGQLNLHWQRIPKSAESCTAALWGTLVSMFGWQLANEISWNPRICDDTVTVLFISKSKQKVMANHVSRCVSSANCRSDNGLSPAWSHPWAKPNKRQLSYSIIELYRTRQAIYKFCLWSVQLSLNNAGSFRMSSTPVHGRSNKQRWDLLSRMRRPEVVHEQFMRLDFAGTGERC